MFSLDTFFFISTVNYVVVNKIGSNIPIFIITKRIHIKN